jgi:polysaccharide export outer membrane protein
MITPTALAELQSTITAGDVMRIRVFAENDLTGTYQVSDSGTIDFPLVGRLKVDGLTPPQVVSLLQTKLADGLLREPHVSVLVEELKKKKSVVIWGQVKSPGAYVYEHGMTIIKAISQAGGMSAVADEKGVTVTRTVKGKAKTFIVPVMEGQAANYPVTAGDVIFVPERYF